MMSMLPSFSRRGSATLTSSARIRSGGALALSAACLTLVDPSASASTILRRSLSDLVKGAEVVFEGTVVSSTVVPGVNNRPPHTCVTFDVADVIAGENPGQSLQLCFLGGEVNGQQTVVSDMTYPTVGEHGIYIAESTHQAMVNPIAGWDQGHFLVEKDPTSGAEKVLTAHRHPVIGIGAEASLPSAGGALQVGDAASGVVAGDGPDIGHAMARDTFKSWLKSAR